MGGSNRHNQHGPPFSHPEDERLMRASQRTAETRNHDQESDRLMRLRNEKDREEFRMRGCSCTPVEGEEFAAPAEGCDAHPDLDTLRAERPDRGLVLDYRTAGNTHSYIRTSTGRVIRIDDPVWSMENGQVCIEDIAHALSHTSRFGGHAKGAYSVSQHCVRAYGAAEHGDKFWALMHDAPEAYMVDLVSPLKRLSFIRPAWTALEAKWDLVMRSLFCIKAPQWNIIAQEARVKAIDTQLLGRELIDLLPYGNEDAENIVYTDGRTPDKLPADEPIWSPERAKLEFLAAYTACTGQGVPK